jgi:hypothetical protein
MQSGAGGADGLLAQREVERLGGGTSSRRKLPAGVSYTSDLDGELDHVLLLGFEDAINQRGERRRASNGMYAELAKPRCHGGRERRRVLKIELLEPSASYRLTSERLVGAPTLHCG